jgi:transcription initiation factor IIE alpha subunit
MVVQSWTGYILTLLLIVADVYLMTDLDFFDKQTQELQQIKKELVQDIMSYLFSRDDVDKEEVRNYLRSLESTSSDHWQSHVRSQKRNLRSRIEQHVHPPKMYYIFL